MVVLGEDATAPAALKPVVWCERHPAHDAPRGPKIDLAVCALESPVVGVQIVPPLQGCERDALRPGAATLIAGFGNTQSWIGDGEYIEGEGAGLKRFIAQSVYELRASLEEVDLVAIGSPGGGCHGDSGDGAFSQISDGTWRLFGVAETLFDPDVLPDLVPGKEDGACGTGTTYSLLADRLTWIEFVTGSDVTPCFTSSDAADGCCFHCCCSFGAAGPDRHQCGYANRRSILCRRCRGGRVPTHDHRQLIRPCQISSSLT